MKQIRKRLTYANVMSSIAVFLVIGGGAAFAATQLPPNSVGSPQIKKNAVKTGDIARNAVRTGKLAPEAAKAGKIAKNAITTNRLRDNAVATDKIAKEAVLADKLGAKAVTSEKIADEAVTTSHLAKDAVTASKLGTITNTVVTKTVLKEDTLSEVISCPAGGKVLSGGYFTSATGVVQVTRFRPNGDTEWAFSFKNDSASNSGVDMHIRCLLG